MWTSEFAPREKNYDSKEIKKKLEDYIPVETKLWSKLKRAEDVRYFKSARK